MSTKLLLALGLTLLTAGVVYFQTGLQADRDESARAQFETWKRNYGRKYGNLEGEYRFQIYKSNLEFVNEHNAAGNTFEVELNNFADITNEEYQAKYLTKLSRGVSTGSNTFTLSGSRPDEVDWRKNDVVTHVKNQGSCGSCWAFSAVGALEGAFHLAGQNVELSEQELVDCSKEDENAGCNGGLMDSAFKYVIANGIATESEYPYAGRDQKCNSSGKSRNRISSFTNIKNGDKPATQEAMLEALAQQPVSVAVNAGGLGFQFYRKGVLTGGCDGAPEKLNHGVLAAGYGAESGKPFYLVKNSWGPTWGDNGYIRLAILDQSQDKNGYGQCGIQNEPSFPTL